MIDYSDIELVIGQCFEALSVASMEKCETDKADRTAALFLTAQMKLSFLIEDVEMKAKGSKNDITRIEGEKYFSYKDSNLEKKITENMLTSYLAKEPEVVLAKKECAQFESSLKKWNYILDTLKNGHVFFRNLGKNKTWSE